VAADSTPAHPGGGTVVVLNRDLMFGSRIDSAARSLGFEPRFVRDLPALAAALAAPGRPPVLAVIDMNAPLDWGAVAALVADFAGRVPVLGFGPHVDVEGRRAAKGAGLSRIVSNGEFHRDTAGIIARYARAAERPT
jgi:hypothetical protein